MDCGPACLMMVAAAHGRKYPLPYLREHSHLSREGVSAQGIMDAAETVGFRTMAVKVPYDTGTYYYEAPVNLDISIVVDGEKLLTIQGGKKNSNFFSPVPDFGSGGGHLCEAF